MQGPLVDGLQRNRLLGANRSSATEQIWKGNVCIGSSNEGMGEGIECHRDL